VLFAAAVFVTGCGSTVPGTPTWPGATLQRQVLSDADFPPGVEYKRIRETPGQPDGLGQPGSMLSRPEGCANALTNVIGKSAERGPGSAVKYSVSYDGARVLMTVLSWNLDLEKLAAEADRCAKFEAFFDPSAEGIPITTTELPGVEPGTLAYQQTMQLGDASNSVYMAFQNIGGRAMIGLAFPASDHRIAAKAILPQTFLEILHKQAGKIRAT
jgi:hypothetical protein